MGVKNWPMKTEYADVAQEVEHILGKDEVSGSSPDISSNEKSPQTLRLRACAMFVDSSENRDFGRLTPIKPLF